MARVLRQEAYGFQHVLLSFFALLLKLFQETISPYYLRHSLVLLLILQHCRKP
ncbi:hypothetical protein MOHU_12030 [Moorella humiferrea]|uniref:Uncharacterized protein n=1 Tax=Neomoorella humiferrea TaxID=676965 RepID=A0A2T0AST3_9FIRM|nr:hypothetical protein MOHU_12030 [Moorella humiferrea]